MARFRTRSPADAARFVRSLSERGYARVEVRHGRGGIPKRDTFRAYRVAGWFVVTYFEPHTKKSIPQPDPVLYRGIRAGEPPLRTQKCSEPDCDRPARTRGLCPRCWARWAYWNRRHGKEEAA